MKPAGERGNPLLRIADRVVLIPVILGIALFRRITNLRAREIPEDPKVIGFLKTSGIGDAVILSGVIADARSRYPNAHIVLFSGKSNHAFARLIEGPDEVIALPVKRPFEALGLVRSRRPDIMIDFGMWPRIEAMLTTLSGAKWMTGVRTPGQHRHYAYDLAIDHSTEHEIMNYRNLVAPLGIQSTSRPAMPTGLGKQSPLNRPYAVFHLWPGGSNSAERSWPTDRWKNIAERLERRGYTIVLTGGPADIERAAAVVNAWNADGLDVISVAGLDAEETILWLRHASVVISVNTGLMHLAAAVGAPTIALNGPTSGRRWGPIGDYTRCVSSPMVPDGYLNLGWERDARYRDCMQAITEDAVVSALDDLLAEVRDDLLEANGAAS